MRLALGAFAVFVAAFALVACGDDDDAEASESNGGGNGPQVIGAYARFTKADLGAAYFEITGGDEDDRLVGASTNIADAEVHEVVVQGATSEMRHVDAVDVPAGETVTFAPGSYHIMLMDVTELPEEGSSFPIELTFANSGTVTIDVRVDAVPSSTGTADSDGHDDHDDHADHDSDHDVG